MFAVEKSPPASPEITEEERLAGRAEVRRRQAAYRLVRDRYHSQQRAIADFDRRADEAAADHAATTEPLQARLAELESLITESLAQREPVPDGLEAERVDLLTSVAQANEALEHALAPIKSAKLAAQRQLNGMAQEVGGGAALESELTRPPLANPELLVDKFVAEQAVAWGERRLRAGEEQLRAAIKQLAGIRNAGKKTDLSWSGHAVARGVDAEAEAKAKWRVRKWTREVETARDALASAMQAGRDVHQALCDE